MESSNNTPKVTFYLRARVCVTIANVLNYSWKKSLAKKYTCSPKNLKLLKCLKVHVAIDLCFCSRRKCKYVDIA